MYRGTDSQFQAVAKIAVLTSVFEKLVAEASAQHALIEEQLAAWADEPSDAAPPTAESRERAA
jgi:hypothetical protein